MRIRKSIYIIMMIIFLFVGNLTLDNTNVNARSHTMVYITKSGKRYFYDRYDKGLNYGHAKKIYKISLNKARAKGFTLSATESGAKSTRRHINRNYYHHSYHRHSIR